jgi:hypothetical protein
MTSFALHQRDLSTIQFLATASDTAGGVTVLVHGTRALPVAQGGTLFSSSFFLQDFVMTGDGGLVASGVERTVVPPALQGFNQSDIGSPALLTLADGGVALYDARIAVTNPFLPNGPSQVATTITRLDDAGNQIAQTRIEGLSVSGEVEVGLARFGLEDRESVVSFNGVTGQLRFLDPSSGLPQGEAVTLPSPPPGAPNGAVFAVFDAGHLMRFAFGDDGVLRDGFALAPGGRVPEYRLQLPEGLGPAEFGFAERHTAGNILILETNPRNDATDTELRSFSMIRPDEPDATRHVQVFRNGAPQANSAFAELRGIGFAVATTYHFRDGQTVNADLRLFDYEGDLIAERNLPDMEGVLDGFARLALTELAAPAGDAIRLFAMWEEKSPGAPTLSPVQLRGQAETFRVTLDNAGTLSDDLLLGLGGADSLRGLGGNDRLVGRAGNDLLDGGAGQDRIAAGTGTDTARGGAGGDRIDGGDGNDVLSGGSGRDTLTGGNGADRLSGGTGADLMQGGAGRDSLAGGAGADSLTGGAASDTLTGGAGNDSLRGGGDNDTLNGNAGNDTLRGEARDDVLIGAQGDDSLFGGLGADVLIGGAGQDTMSGGRGADTFEFRAISDSARSDGPDLITDFARRAGDRIDLSGIDANAGQRGNQAFVFVGQAGFGDTAGELRFVTGLAGGATRIDGDRDGDGQADFRLFLDGDLTLRAADFIL